MRQSTEPAPFREKLFWLVVVLQVLAVVAVIVWRVSLLGTGTTVLLRCAPVDPRSLFSGDYVVLSYDISEGARDLAGSRYTRGETVYVALRPQTDDPYWVAARVSHRRDWLAGEYDVVLRGRVRDWRRSIHFGIENYFVPQYEGRRIENSLREAEVHAEVAVAPSGHAALKRLFIDGEEVRFY